MRTIVSGSLMMNTVTSRTGLRPKISSKRFYDRGDGLDARHSPPPNRRAAHGQFLDIGAMLAILF
ncbi:hypothetical protein GGD66_008190 [Bradyrhizobium sp. CIR48]|nr:hypothetical protein [Bradyrhizobium sp. CIR3A]MBB4360672.1 hypothetical protein [Bradyrhizobium sp. CIR18]MBB4429586.1 hypothetical protein [Bradyrhizobium sp. CIR48]